MLMLVENFANDAPNNLRYHPRFLGTSSPYFGESPVFFRVPAGGRDRMKLI